MTTKNLRSRNPILLVMALLLAAGGGVARAEVRDNAGFFSEDAVRQATFDLREIKQRHGKDLLIETNATVPANMRSQLQQLGENKFYAQWAAARATEAKIDGAAVLITKEPSHLHVVVGDRARQSGAFRTEDGGKLREQLVTNFRVKQYDQGLLAAVRTFRETLSTNLGGAGAATPVERTPAAAPSAQRSSNEPQANPGAFDPRADKAQNRGSGGGGGGISFFKLIIWGIVILIIIRVVSRLFRRRQAQQQPGGVFGGPFGAGGPFSRSRYGQQGYDPRYGGGMGGGMGGFGTGLGGGLLGGLLGGWLGGRMFGGGSSTAHGAPPPTSTGQEPGVFSNEHDAGFASSGGSSFSDAGGADFGGGGDFSGGGDAGGGDF